MSVIIILILASLAMALLFLGGFVWAVRSGQFEDTLTPAMRVLPDEAQAAKPPPSAEPALPLTLTLSRRERELQSPGLRASDVPPAISDSRNLQDRRSVLPRPLGVAMDSRPPGIMENRQPPLTPSLSPSDGERVSAGRVRGIPGVEGRAEGEPCEFKTSDVPPAPAQTQD